MMEEDEAMESPPIFSWSESMPGSGCNSSKRKYEEDSGCYTGSLSSSQLAATISWHLGTSDEGFCESPRKKPWDTCGSSHWEEDWEKKIPILPMTPEIPISLPEHSPQPPKFIKCRDRDIPSINNSCNTSEFTLHRPTFYRHSQSDFIYRFSVASNHHMILSKIFSYLSDNDLTMMSMVSKAWYNYINSNKEIRERYQNNCIVRKLTKENFNSISSSSVMRSPLKSMGNHSTPLHHVAASSPPCSPSKFKFNLYVKEAKKLKEGEYLIHCPKCDLPCKCTPLAKLAKCVRVGCSLEFCTECQSPYHNGSPCILLSPPGSKTPPKRITKKQSRKNLRRLLLDS